MGDPKSSRAATDGWDPQSSMAASDELVALLELLLEKGMQVVGDTCKHRNLSPKETSAQLAHPIDEQAMDQSAVAGR